MVLQIAVQHRNFLGNNISYDFAGKLSPLQSIGDVKYKHFYPGKNRRNITTSSVPSQQRSRSQKSPINKYRNNSAPLSSADNRSLSGRCEQANKNKDTISFASLRTDLPSTDLQQKVKMFRLNLTTILSCIYAVFIFTIGLIIFIFDIFINSEIAEIYCLYLVSMGFIYIMYLFVDIRVYINKAKKHHKEKRKHEETYDAMMRETEIKTFHDAHTVVVSMKENNFQHSSASLELPSPVTPLEHPYCFNQGRHAGSFYLKLGAAGFCLGHLVHSALLLSVQLVYLNSADCGSTAILALDVIYPIYSFCQLFFIFKYSNVIILKCKIDSFAVGWLLLNYIQLSVELACDLEALSTHLRGRQYIDPLPAEHCKRQFDDVRFFIESVQNRYLHSPPGIKEIGRFALMHCIASSLCFWIWTIIRETMDSLNVYAKKNEHKDINAPRMLQADFQTEFKPLALALTSYRIPGSHHLRHLFNVSPMVEDNCSIQHGFDVIFNDFSPYLYPFTIEYSILVVMHLLAVGIFFILWQNIGTCPKDDYHDSQTIEHDKEDWMSYKSSWESRDCKVPTALDDNGMVSNLVIHVDCHSSNKGLFCGLFVLVLTLVSVIICFIAITSDDFAEIGVLMKDTSELALHVVMLVAAVMAYGQIKRLDVNTHPVSFLDDLLLFICIPAFFMEATFTLIPSVIYGNYLKFSVVIFVVLQVLVQTPLITDSQRRCSNSRQLQRAKPGRELITFLVVCNVATWIFETFSVKNADMNDDRYDFYGKVLWTILGHVSTPLCMFYRFHSSVCLADVWKGAYQPGR